MLHNTKRSLNNFNREISTDFLLGLGVGYKWVSKKGIILQANFSPGINLFNNSPESISGRAGISIGKRF